MYCIPSNHVLVKADEYFSLLPLLIQQSISPNLAKALNNPALRQASYSLPDGTIVIDPKKQTPNLKAALQNPYLRSASYTLPDGTIVIDPRKPVSPNLSSALQNSALRGASFTLPEGVHDPNIPISPNLVKVSYGFRPICFFYVSPYFHTTSNLSCVLIYVSFPPSYLYIRTCVERHRYRDLKSTKFSSSCFANNSLNGNQIY